MERLRWMKHDFPQPYIWVDVAKQELYYIENNSIQFNMRVVVGKPTRPTTMLLARLQNIVFNPPWTVPPTIMKEDVIPGIAKRGTSYLTRKGLKAFDKNGKQVANADINAMNINKYKVRQAPGYRSSLGEVKFNLLNPWSIYLHDTPHREDFLKFYRAYSSGCIRVHHPKEFAAFLLRDSAKYSNTKIDSICNTRKTMYVPMHRDVMVHIVYLTNALDSTGHVMYLKDVYKWDAVKK
jgi:murein L,D-transpeptidase YcbB/YkuD